MGRRTSIFPSVTAGARDRSEANVSELPSVAANCVFFAAESERSFP
jgi:hypothetical protein